MGNRDIIGMAFDAYISAGGFFSDHLSYLIKNRIRIFFYISFPGIKQHLCYKRYHEAPFSHPETYLLQIRGYEWEFLEKLSARAEQNLSLALNFLKERITAEDFHTNLSEE